MTFVEAIDLCTDVPEEGKGFPSAEEHDCCVREFGQEIVSHRATTSNRVSSNFRRMEAKVVESHSISAEAKEINNEARCNVGEGSVGILVHADLSLKDGCVVVIGDDTLNRGCESANTAQSGVGDMGAIHVDSV